MDIITTIGYDSSFFFLHTVPEHYPSFSSHESCYSINRIKSAFVEDGSYLKLREVSLRITLDSKTLEKFAGGFLADIFNRLTLGVIGRNLLTFTGYSGFDPEGGSGDATLMRMDNFGYPLYRTLTGLVEVEL